MTADFINSLAWFLVGYPATQKTLGRKVTLIHLLCFHGMLLRYINYSWSLVPFKVLLVCFFCAPSILVSLLLFRSLMCRFELERFTLKGWKMRKRTALVDLYLKNSVAHTGSTTRTVVVSYTFLQHYASLESEKKKYVVWTDECIIIMYQQSKRMTREYEWTKKTKYKQKCSPAFFVLCYL